MTSLTARWHRSINEIPEQQWNSLVGDAAIPFYRWSWLEALESSGSIIPEQGWQPLHLALWRDDIPIAVAPLFLKGHSYGEFVFDQTFARLAADLGLRYYPKLLGMSPVSPVLGYRFHVRSGEDEALLTRELLRAIDRFCEQNGILSCNFLYVDPQWRPLAEAAGCAAWLNQQSLWSRGDDQSFEDYLKGFNANQRRNIKRERKAVAKAGITVTPLSGDQLDLTLLQSMHRFYEQHCARWGPWGSKYLEEGFEALARLHRDQLVLFSAHRGDPRDPVAMSMSCRTADSSGAAWGSHEDRLSSLRSLLLRSDRMHRLGQRHRNDPEQQWNAAEAWLETPRSPDGSDPLELAGWLGCWRRSSINPEQGWQPPASGPLA